MRYLVHPLAGQVIRRFSREQFIENDAHGIDVRPNIEFIGFGGELLGTHVLQRADELPDVGVHGGQCSIRVRAASDAEVDDLRGSVAADEDVARFQVAVDDPLLMPVCDRFTDLAEQCDACMGRQGVVARVVNQGFGVLDHLHHEVRDHGAGHVLETNRVDLGDARVRQAGEHLGLVLEPFHEGWRDDARADDLDGDRAMGLVLKAFVDSPHASIGDDLQDRDAPQLFAEQAVFRRWCGSHSEVV